MVDGSDSFEWWSGKYWRLDSCHTFPVEAKSKASSTSYSYAHSELSQNTIAGGQDNYRRCRCLIPSSKSQTNDRTTLLYTMSDSVGTKDTQSTKDGTPSMGVQRSISWASDVKPPREGGMGMGAKWVPLKEKDTVPDDTSDDEEQEDKSEGDDEHASASDDEELDDEAEGEGEQLKSEQSGCGASRGGSIITQPITLPSRPRSVATTSKPVTSGLPSEAGVGPSQWGNK